MPATPLSKTTRKPGANRNERTRRHAPKAANFKQSRDLREDRGERQIKMTLRPASGRR
jgi:hypothetical protein